MGLTSLVPSPRKYNYLVRNTIRRETRDFLSTRVTLRCAVSSDGKVMNWLRTDQSLCT